MIKDNNTIYDIDPEKDIETVEDFQKYCNLIEANQTQIHTQVAQMLKDIQDLCKQKKKVTLNSVDMYELICILDNFYAYHSDCKPSAEVTKILNQVGVSKIDDLGRMSKLIELSGKMQILGLEAGKFFAKKLKLSDADIEGKSLKDLENAIIEKQVRSKKC